MVISFLKESTSFTVFMNFSPSLSVFLYCFSFKKMIVQVTIEKKNRIITAKIKAYTVIVDLDKKVIIHNCTDWTKYLKEKTFCKHVAQLFLRLPESDTKSVLYEILARKDSWQFLEIL